MPKPRVKIVKSAQRVVEILEFFGAHRAEATVMDFVRLLDYPQSSTSELLQSLVALGYLDYDRLRRTYRPALRTALVNNWVWPEVLRKGHLLEHMDRLAVASRRDVVLGAMQGYSLRQIFVARGAADTNPLIEYSPRSPFLSALGRVILANWPQQQIQDFIRRLNADERNPARWLKPAEVLEDLAEVTAAGHAVSQNEAGSGYKMLALPIDIGNGEILAVGLKGRPIDLRDDRLSIDLLSDVIDAATGAKTPPVVFPPAPAGTAALPHPVLA